MSQAVEKRVQQRSPTGGKSPARLPAPAEHPLALESRLRIMEADARWKRLKEMVLIGSVAFVVLDACFVSTMIVLSGSSTPSDKYLAIFLLGQLICILLGALIGKTIKWKS